MRHPRSLSPTWLNVTILLIYLTHITTQTQSHLVCRRPDSRNCLVWMVVENNGNKKIVTSSKTISTYCGLSHLGPAVHLHRRYVQFGRQARGILCACVRFINRARQSWRYAVEEWRSACTQTVKEIRSSASWTRPPTVPYQFYDWRATLSTVYKFQELENIPSTKTILCNQFTRMGVINDWKEITNMLETAKRTRRQTFTPRGRYRGQTQSQYLAIDRGNGKDEGKAEAHSAADSSRAIVSGNSGMGQAQSQSIYDPNCEDCGDRKKYEIENLKRPAFLKPGDWPGQNGLIQSPDRRYNQNGPDHYGDSAFMPTLENTGSMPKGNGNDIFVPQNVGTLPAGSSGSSNTPLTHNGYSPNNFPGANDYRPIASQAGNGYKPTRDNYDPSDTTGNKNFGPHGYKTGFTPIVNSNDKGYLPNSNLGLDDYRDPNTRLESISNNKPGPSNLGRSDLGLYEPQSGNKNYLPGYGTNRYNDQIPGNIPSGQGNDLNQGRVDPFRNGIPRDSMDISKPTTSHIDPRYAPGSQISNPNVGIRPYESVNEFGKRNPPSLNQGESGVPHFSMASGPYPGPGGSSVYCCVVPNPQQNGNLYPDYRPGDANLGLGSSLNHQSGKPNGQYGGNQFIPSGSGNYGQYNPTNTGFQYEPKSNVGTTVSQGSHSSPGGQYGNVVHPYGSTTVEGSYPPGVQLDPRSTLHSLDRPYNLNAPSGSVLPNGQYIPVGTGISGGSSMPGGQYKQGSAVTPIGTGFQYGTNVPGSPGILTGPYQPNNVRQTSNNGVDSPANIGFPYGPSDSGSSTSPGGQYGINVPTGTASEAVGPTSTTSGQYRPGINGPGGQFSLNGHNGDGRLNDVGNQYRPGIPGVLPSNGNGYMPGENKGLVGNRGQYETTNLGGGPVEHYGSGDPTDSLGSRGHNEPGNLGEPNRHTGQYNPSGSAVPGGQYRPNNIGGAPGTVEQYGPSGQNRPGDLDGSSVGNVAIRPGGQYGQNLPFGTVGQNVLGGTTSPEGKGQFGPGDPGLPNNQYGQVNPGNLGGVYGPGNVVRPGQYSPSNSFNEALPGGQYGSNGPGGAIGNVGQYIPGSDSSLGLGRPDHQYGSNSPDSSAGPGKISDRFRPSGVKTDQYQPGSSDGSAVLNRPYGPNLGNLPGQLGPGVTNENFMPSGKFTPSGDGTTYGYNAGPGGHVGGYNGVPQNYVDPNAISADGDDSAAEASVAQNINGTTASASSKGGNDKGRAQTNVQGTYTGSGSFQAQAQITGENKEALSEVNGGKKGASSSASGSGRNNKSQANVQLGSETGSVQTHSQSNGAMHSSNSQVQGSVKGGMADAQARGPGSTSSQAQIGFTPYKDSEKSNHDLQKIPFMGGGMASAQSSGRTGQSQSQLHGTFKYGISYSGAAQSGSSLDKDAVFPNRLSFEKINVFDEKDKNIDVEKINMDVAEVPDTKNTEAFSITETPSSPAISQSSAPDNPNIKKGDQSTTTENILDESMKNSESRYTGHAHLDHHLSAANKTTLVGPTLSSSRRSFQTNFPTIPEYEFTTDRDDTQPEYDTDVGYDGDGNEANDVEQPEYSNYDEYTKDPSTHQYLQSPNRKDIDVRQSTGGNSQHIVLGSLKNHNAEIIQKDSGRPDESKVYQPGERVPGTGGYTIPIGFTGSVKSVASKDNTYVIGSKESPSQAQTVTLMPGTGKVKYTHPSSYGRHVNAKNLRSLQSPKEDDNKYVSVSKSVTRALDSDNNIRKQYLHTYYTKSSSCGYFTFTCTMVSSAEGRKKVCKPKMPTNPDGTPIRC